MFLYLVRHGECLGQYDPTYQKDPDSPLSTLGEEQSERTAEQLHRVGFTHIVSSPLLRALETATLITGVKREPAVEVWLELREGFSPRHQGLSVEKLADRFPTAALPSDITGKGWEHGGDVYEGWYPRCQSVLNRLQTRFSREDRVVLVTHGGFANYLLHAVMNISFQTPLWFELANCSISTVRFVPNPNQERPNWPLYPPVQVEVLSLNETTHLAGLTP